MPYTAGLQGPLLWRFLSVSLYVCLHQLFQSCSTEAILHVSFNDEMAMLIVYFPNVTTAILSKVMVHQAVSNETFKHKSSRCNQIIQIWLLTCQTIFGKLFFKSRICHWNILDGVSSKMLNKCREMSVYCLSFHWYSYMLGSLNIS